VLCAFFSTMEPTPGQLVLGRREKIKIAYIVLIPACVTAVPVAACSSIRPRQPGGGSISEQKSRRDVRPHRFPIVEASAWGGFRGSHHWATCGNPAIDKQMKKRNQTNELGGSSVGWLTETAAATSTRHGCSERNLA